MMQNRIKIVISLGSNVNQVENMGRAKGMLADAFEDLRFSSEMWTEPIGLVGSELFLNGVATAMTTLDKQEVEARLKEIERVCGRAQDETRKAVVAIDLDLLMYGEEVLRRKDWEREYIMKGLKEVESSVL